MAISGHDTNAILHFTFPLEFAERFIIDKRCAYFLRIYVHAANKT